MLKIRKFTAAALLILGIFIAPSLVQADSSYRIFTLTPDQLGQASSGDYRRCVTLAGVNTSSRSDCVIAEQSLVDRRIVSRDRAILAQMSGTDMRARRREQQTWIRIRDRDCAATWRRLMNDQDMVDYLREIRQCRLDESLRRTAWLERGG